MFSKSLIVMAAAALVAACSCIRPGPVAPSAPAVSSAEPAALAKEAEQVIALAEKAKEPVPAAPSLTPPAEPAAPSPAGLSRCWLKGDLRTIATEQGKDGSCQVIYDSTGQHHVVANKSHDLTECSRLHERLKKNLVASGFRCE